MNFEKKSWDESKYDYIDVLVSSGEIRRHFFQRCKDLSLDPVVVALKAGFTASAFKRHYLNCPKPTAKNGFPQDKFIKMLEIVGIEIKILTILKPFHETYVELEKNNLIK